MTDRPIIFSAPMVRALLAGRKTMTRRLAWRASLVDTPGNVRARRVGYLFQQASPWQRVKPGDRLWVRESLALHGAFGLPLSEAPQVRPDGERVWSYVVDDVPNRSGGRPSVHMPRWASRLTLVVTAVRVEPLHAISLADIRAEGMTALIDWHPLHFDATDAWRKLWTELHGRESWSANPEVVVLAFTVHRQNIDAMERATAPDQRRDDPAAAASNPKN